MRITFLVTRSLLDAENEESMDFNPGAYQFEERPNPFGQGPPWYCLKGTYVGMSSTEFQEWARPVNGERLIIIEA